MRAIDSDRLLLTQSGQFPKQRIRQMASNEFLKSAKAELARYVSKTGDFALVENVIDQCKARLDTDEIVSLYEYIRDESHRLEEEWRDEFIDAFDNIEPFLPDVEVP